MAAPVLVSSQTLFDVPFLLRKLVITSGATVTALAHGGPAVKPVMVWGTQTSANPTGADFAWTDSSTTTVTLDFEDDGNDTWDVYVLFTQNSAGGISA